MLAHRLDDTRILSLVVFRRYGPSRLSSRPNPRVDGTNVDTMENMKGFMRV